jgi:hypothetical protein
MDDKGKQFYDYLSSQGIEVPPSYEEFSTQMQNKETAGQFHSFVSSKGIEVPKSIDEFTSVFAPIKSTAPEKKSSTGPTPGALSGLGGSLGGPSPLAASKTPPKTTFGEGALEEIVSAKIPEPKRQMPVRDGSMPTLPSNQLTSLPPVEFYFNGNLVKPSAVSDPRKLTQEIEKAALSQAGLNPEEFKKQANDAIRQKEAGEVEMGMYVVDGKAIPSEQFKDLIFDQTFIEEARNGLHNVQINPSNDEYVSQFLDQKLVDAASRNLQSGTRIGDKWESFMSGAATMASGVAGIETMYYDVAEEVLGIPLRRDLFGVSELQETSEELAKKSEEYQKKTFEYRDNFLKSILNGNFSDAAQQAGDATSASIPHSAGAAALNFAGGPALAFAVLAPMSSSAEYASMKVSEDEAYTQLSRAEKLLRSSVTGPLQAGTDLVAGRAISRSFDLTKSLYKGLIKDVAENQGLEAADKAAKELSKSVIRKYGENIGLQMTEEFFAEGGSTAATMLYDDLMGIRSYNAKDYISETLNSGLLGSAAGGITTGALSGPAAIYATGLTAKDKLKSVFDRKLYEDPNAVESLSKQVDSMDVPNEVKEDLKNNLDKRKKAVSAVPDNLVEDTEVVDKVQEKQALEEQKRNLDPVFAKPIEEKIAKIDEELAKKAAEDSAKKDNKPTTEEQQFDDLVEQYDLKVDDITYGREYGELSEEEQGKVDALESEFNAKEDDIIEKYGTQEDKDYLEKLNKKINSTTENLLGRIGLGDKKDARIQDAKDEKRFVLNSILRKSRNRRQAQREEEYDAIPKDLTSQKIDSLERMGARSKRESRSSEWEEGRIKQLKDDPIKFWKERLVYQEESLAEDPTSEYQKESVKDIKDEITRLENLSEKPKTTTPIEPVVFSTPTDERYARVNDNDGTQGGTRDLTKQEYLDWKAKNKPVTEQLTTSKTEQNAKQQQSEQMREQGVQGQPQGKSDSNMPIVNQTELQDGQAPKEEVVSVEGGVESRRNKQLEIINKTNPAPNNYNTWIRKVEDIKTADEVFEVAKKEGAMYPDFTEEQMQDALDSGEITIYSSNPIENGVFVTPSKMNAQEYAGGKGGKLYSKKVKLEDIAWIDESEGQYAVVEQPQAEPTKEAPKEPVSESELKKKKTIKQLESENKTTLPKVRSEKVFLNESTPLNREETKGVDKVIKDEAESSLPIESISVEQIIPTQKNLTIPNLEKTKGVTNSKEEILLVEKDGKFYVIDGHHRIANQILNGDKTISARVFRDKKPTKPFVESFGTPVEDLNDVSEGVMQTNLDGVNVLMSEVDENTVKLESIETPKRQRNKGKAKAALQKIIDKADELGKTIILDVNPKNENSTSDIANALQDNSEPEELKKVTGFDFGDKEGSWDFNDMKTIAKAYQKAKKDGTNPSLVEAVEKIIKPTTEEGLRKLYEGFGFTPTKGIGMERKPGAKPSAKQAPKNATQTSIGDAIRALPEKEQQKVLDNLNTLKQEGKKAEIAAIKSSGMNDKQLMAAIEEINQRYAPVTGMSLGDAYDYNKKNGLNEKFVKAVDELVAGNAPKESDVVKSAILPRLQRKLNDVFSKTKGAVTEILPNAKALAAKAKELGDGVRYQILSDYRDNNRFKFSDLIYPDVVFKDIKTEAEAEIAINFYKKIVRVFNTKFNRDLKVSVEKQKGNFRIVVEYETGLKPKYFAYPTATIGEHEVVDAIDKNIPLTSLRHELIHEMLVKHITDKFERINNMDNSAEAATIDEVQRGRAYNYTLEDVFFERVVENVERLPDNKDTFTMDTFAIDVVNRIVKELENASPSKADVMSKLSELLEGSNPWLVKNITESVALADFSKPLSESTEAIGKKFSQKFNVSKDVFSKDLQRSIFEFTQVFNEEYSGVLTRLKKIDNRQNIIRSQPAKGNRLFSEPLKAATTIAEKYMASIGLKLPDANKITSVNQERAIEIARLYDEAKDSPNDPITIESYQKMIAETIEQYKTIAKEGYSIVVNNSEPYSSSTDMIEDLEKNKSMKIFSTESGFGDKPITDQQRAENPLLMDSGFKDVNGVPLLANDIFRFVHDFFGHSKLGNGFGAIGEENAWMTHAQMYSPLARRAMTSETRGQNSYVNFSGVNDAAFAKRDEARRLRAQGKDAEADALIEEVYDMMIFADQKITLLPEWVADPEADFSAVKNPTTSKKISKLDGSEKIVKRTHKESARALASAYTKMGKRERRSPLGTQIMSELQKIAKDNGLGLLIKNRGGIVVLSKYGKEIRRPQYRKSPDEIKAAKDAKKYRNNVLNADPIGMHHYVAMKIANGTRFDKKELQSLVGKNANIPAWMWLNSGGVKIEFLREMMSNDGFGVSEDTDMDMTEMSQIADEIAYYATPSGRLDAYAYADEIYQKQKNNGYTDAEVMDMASDMGYVGTFAQDNTGSIFDELPSDVKESVESELKNQKEYEESAQYKADLERYFGVEPLAPETPVFHYDSKGEVLGFSHGGKLYLNGEKITAQTTMEEAGHVWINAIKESNPELYNEGIAKTSGSQYLADVVKSPYYKAEAEKLGKPASKAYNEYMQEEALAKAIADNGAKFVSESKKSSFKEWVNEMWKAVVKQFGIKDMSIDSVKKMTLDEFATKAAADIFSREKSKPGQATVLSENLSKQLEGVRSVPKNEEAGATMNLDGTSYSGPEIITPIDSQNFDLSTVSVDDIIQFIKKNEKNIGGDSVKIGLYKFDSESKLFGQISVDINIAVPNEHREVGIKFAGLAGQESVYDLGTGKPVKTGNTGADTMEFTPEQFLEIYDSLLSGKLPEAVSEKSIAMNKVRKAAAAFRKASGGLQSGGFMALPEFVALTKALIEAGFVTAKEFIQQFRAFAPDSKVTDKELTDALNNELAGAGGTGTGKKRRGKGKGPKKGKKKSYEARQLKEFADSQVLTDAIKATGTRYEAISWKDVEPISNSIVADIFSDPSTVNEKAKALADTIAQTTNEDYRNNDALSTLHALVAHQMIAEFARIGDVDSFQKWSKEFSDDSRHRGRFISAMQSDASDYAITNGVTKRVYDEMGEALSRTTPDGSKIQDVIDELKKKLELTEEEVKRLEGIVAAVTAAAPPQTSPSVTSQPPSPQQQKKGLDRVKSGLAKLSAAISGTRRQMNAMMPITTEIIDAIKEIALGIAESGVYQAEKIRKAVMKQIKAAFPNDKNAVDSIDAALDGILEDDAIEEAMDDAEEASFVEKLVARAKANAVTKAPKPKTAEQVLLDTLLAKVNETIKKEGKPVKLDESIRRIKEGIQEAEFGDEVWQEAMNNIAAWLETQPNISDARKQEILAQMEDSVAAFMDQPFANSDLRKALKSGTKDLGIEIKNLVKQHWTKQNAGMQSIENRLIYELGLSIPDAQRYSAAIVAEINSMFEGARKAEINRMLGLDADGNVKGKKSPVNSRVSDKIIAAINLGVMDDLRFRGMFAEKYGFTELTPKDIKMIRYFNDLINIHQGNELSQYYLKQMMDYIENLKPYDAEKFFNTTKSLMIRGMLNGMGTMMVNIPVGSQLSYMASMYPMLMSNPVAAALFRKEFGAAGLGGIGIRTFGDIMMTGFDAIEGSGKKFDDRKEVRGDQVDYWLNNYDGSKMWEDVRNAKSPKEAMNAMRIAMGRSMIMTHKIANYAQAFDAIISYRATELDQFIVEYNKQAKAAGYSGLRARFDPTVGKKILEAVRQKMAYDTDTKNRIADEVDDEIAGMRARGERVGFGLKQRLIKSKMESMRDADNVKASLERFRASVLMEAPTGFAGQAYEMVADNLSIPKKSSWMKAGGKHLALSMFGLFLRISVTSVQKSIENTPVVGLVLPGIFYDRKLLPVDPLRPNGAKEWRTVRQDNDTMRAKLMTHAAVMAIFTMAAMSMFAIDDEDDELGRKQKKLKLNPDRWIDITGYGTGKWYDNEQLGKDGKLRKDYTVSIKVNGKWHDIFPARLIPHFLPFIGFLGGLRDEAELNPTDFKNMSLTEQFIKGSDDVLLASTVMSFATIPRVTESLFYAAFNKETKWEATTSVASELASIALNPAKAAIYPNLLRDFKNEYEAIKGETARTGKGVLYTIAKDLPVSGEMVGDEAHDVFGYPKTKTSKILTAVQTVPGSTILLDNFFENRIANEPRFKNPVWVLKGKYQPNLVIASYSPKSETPEDKNMMGQVYGEQMRNLWLSHEKYVKAYDFGQMTELQSIFHKEAVTLMEHKVGTERVEKLQKSYDDGVKSGVSVVKLNKIKESLESWKGKMEDLEMFKFSDDPEINSKYSVKRVYDKMKDHNYDVKVGGGISLPYIPDEE